MEQTKIDMFKKVLAMEPDDPLMNYGLGVEYAHAERHEEAVEVFRKAIEHKEDYSAAYRELGKSLTALGQTEEAIPVFEKGIPIAEENGDIQTGKEMAVFLKRIKDCE